MTTPITTDSSGFPPTRLEHGSLPTQIHDALEEAIIAGRLEPGSRLRADEIAEIYSVSRIPVREALSSLHEAGWVDIRPRYGVYVRARTRTELSQLFEARAAIESELARLGALRASAVDLDDLRGAIARSRQATDLGDSGRLSDAAIDYNAALRRASGNAVLTGISLTLEKRARFYFSPIAAVLGSDWVAGQERLLEFLEAGDEDGSAGSARRHIVETGDSVARLLPADAFSS